MTRYELLLTLHIIAAVAWIGAAISVQLLAVRADRSREPEAMQRIADDAEWLATRLFIPASLLVLILGILLMLDGPWAFDQTWIVLGLAGYAFSFFVGLLFIRPETVRIHGLIGEHGPGHADVRRRIKRIFLVSRFELLILLLVIADMVFKPGL